MPHYILLLHEAPDRYKEFSPAEMQALVEKYAAWRKKLHAAGRLVNGHRLTSDVGRIMRGKTPDTTVIDGPFAEAREIIGGLFVIQAENYQEAVTATLDCPHLDFGAVEVREIMRTVTPETP